MAAALPMSSLIGPSRVDWDVVDEELDRVPEEYKDPRFDSLRHVLDILSAVDAEAALEELKSQQERIEQLVDNVVQGYHSGFNKAIHNYSQILHLFSVSKDQVNKLRSQLEDAQRRLTSRSHSLEIQWKRSVTLGDTVKLLADIRGFVTLPQKVQKLQEVKDWTGAVTALLDGSSRLARPEYSGIGALKEIKRELAALRNSLVKGLIAEAEAAVYERPANARPRPVAAADSLRSSSSTGLALGAMANSSVETRSSGAVQSSGRSGSTPRSPARREELGGSSQRSIDSRKMSSASSRTSLGLQQPDPSADGPCRELIGCVTRLGGIGELQGALRRHLPLQVKRVVLRSLESCKASRPVLMQPTESKWGKGFAVDPAAAAAAARLAETVFENCLQVLHTLVGVLQQVGAARNPAGSAGLDLLLAARPPDAQLGTSGGGAGPSGATYARREADLAWELVQKEVQALLSLLVQPGNASAALAGLKAGVPGSEGSGLSFSFDVQLRGVAARALLQRENSLGKWEGDDMAALASAALSGFKGSLYLTPHIYLPTKSFSAEGVAILATLDKEGDSTGAAWFGSGDKSDSRHILRQFLSSFLENVFMPSLFMDFKSRCAEMLEDPECLRARAKPQAVYAGEVARGRALLPAVRVAEAFAGELLQWSTLVPPFASRMSGILENVLGKVLATFQQHVTSLLGCAAVRALSEDAGLAVQMAAEPAAAQAGDAASFFVGRAADGIDQFVSSILQTGFGSGAEAAEIAVLQRLLRERPVKASALLTVGDTSRVMNLAAAADSLDYLADVIQASVEEHNAVPLSASERSGTLSTPRARTPSGEIPLGPSAGKSGGMALDNLDHLVDRYRSLAGQSLRALRLDMLLLVVHHLEHLARGRYVCDAAEAQDVDECVGALQRSSSRADEAVAPFLPPDKRSYVFGGMAAAAARFVIWLLPELQALNQAGLARMCRMLAVLQPFLAALGSTGGLFRPEAAQHLERARAYYAHLTYSAPALVAAAVARPTRFSAKEYLALLEVDFVGRTVEEAHKAEMAKVVLAAAKKQTKPLSLFSRA